MSHGITAADRGFTVRKPAWHGLYPVLDEHVTSIDEVVERLGLTWEAEKRPIYLGDADGQPGRVIAEHFAVTRSDTEEVLGIVSGRYETVQYPRAFRFAENLLGDLIAETGGTLFGGKQAFLLLRFPDWIEVGGDVIDQYLGIRAGHDGKTAITAAVTPIRWVCNNTVTIGIKTARATYTIRHIGDPSGQLHEARAALGITVDFYKQFKKFGDELATQKFTERQLAKVVEELWPTEKGMTKRQLGHRERAREAVLALFGGTYPTGDTRGNSPGSAWCAFNALVEYHDHVQGVRGDRVSQRMNRQLGDPQGFKHKALQLVAAQVN